MGTPGVKSCSDEEFKQLVTRLGATEAARFLKIAVRAVQRRRTRLQNCGELSNQDNMPEHPERQHIVVKNGCVIIGSDFHIWPGPASVALKAFKKLCKDLKPAAVILNGDILDFPLISRHPRIMWGQLPMPVDEIETAQDHLDDIAKAGGHCHKIWNIGNHDLRFESFLSQNAGALEGIKGTCLDDHFGLWKKGWSCWINNDVVVKHRFKGGMHAPHNNTLWSGKTMVTGHLHSQKVMPITDYNGTRYGIDAGCVAETSSRAFIDYTEDNPKNWISGFVVLTFKEGKMLHPELVSQWSAKEVQFRGEIFKP